LGFYAENAAIPVRALALHNGIGAYGRNGLLRIDPYGSRIALYAIATDAVLPGEVRFVPSTKCHPQCRACEKICPTGAITPEGLSALRCLRYEMDTPEHPEYVRVLQQQFLGCEACMFACPFNAPIPVVEPSTEVRATFELDRLIKGDVSVARVLVGKNMSVGGKLITEAIAFAAREKCCEDEIRAACSSENEAVRNVAAWAIGKYF